MAQVRACLAMRMNETRRERVPIRRDADGTFTAVNGLGVDIETLHYCDEEGRVHIAHNLPAGQEAKLEKGDKFSTLAD